MPGCKKQITAKISESRSSHGQLSFGISDLANPSLLKNFFPEDLPQDWYLSYYANEFELLLVHLSDANCHQLDDYQDEMADDFTTVLDLSQLSAHNKQQLVSNNTFYCVDRQQVLERCLLDGKIRLEWLSAKNNNDKEDSGYFVAYISSEEKIEALILRTLIEQAQAYARLHQCKHIGMIFSSSEFALTNCRNAILLASMM